MKMSFTHHNGIIDFSLASINRQTELSLFLFLFSLLSHSFHLGSRFFHFFFIIIIGVSLHHHWYHSSSSLVFLFIIEITLIGIPFHLLPSFPTFVCPTPQFACQMPSKRAKYPSKIPFFMRYSEICLIDGCLICGAYQQRNKEKKIGTFQIMP